MNKCSILLKSGLMLLINSSALASTYSLDDYYAAKLEVSYKGEIGGLAQSLAQQLQIPYYTYQADPLRVVNIQQDKTHSLADLMQAINKQLPNSVLSFERINDQITLVLEKKQLNLKDGNYIGQVVMTKSNIAPETQSQVANENHKESEATTRESEDDVKMREQAAAKIKSILEMSKDEKLIQQYSKRKQPEYKLKSVEEKDKVGLDTIRSTKISTFLVFKDGVDLKDYQIKGDFQDFAKLGNVAVILHRQKKPPMSIAIIMPDGYETILKN